MAFVKVAKIADLDAEPLIEVMVGDDPYAICKVDGEIHALNGVCPHQGGPLGQGILTGSSIMCPWHAWEFDCRTGASSPDPEDSVQTYPVKIENGDILIDLA